MSDGAVALLEDWRQGDLAREPVVLPIVCFADGGAESADLELEHGVMIITQSCDIIRDKSDKPYVTLAAIIPVTDNEKAYAIKGMKPSLVHVSGLGAELLAVDLDMTFTVEKDVVAAWKRTEGCGNDEERIKLSASLARHRERFAFPDEFNALITPVKRWFEKKVGRDSDHGRFVDLTREVRVKVDSWENPSELTFFVILKSEPSAADKACWQKIVEGFEFAKPEKYPEPEYVIVTLHDISAHEYVSSIHLNWDALSDA